MGMWSSQRGDTPRCWVSATAVSGTSEKLETVSPSTAALSTPEARSRPSSARATNQWALRVEWRT